MILLYMQEISRRPLPMDVAPWRGFIANLDKLTNQIKNGTREDSTSETTTDRRLFRED
jgi:hypothetical protein